MPLRDRLWVSYGATRWTGVWATAVSPCRKAADGPVTSAAGPGDEPGRGNDRHRVGAAEWVDQDTPPWRQDLAAGKCGLDIMATERLNGIGAQKGTV